MSSVGVACIHHVLSGCSMFSQGVACPLWVWYVGALSPVGVSTASVGVSMASIGVAWSQ